MTRDGNRHLAEAAARAGAAMILMSVVGASSESPMELFRMKEAAEKHLRASGAPWTIVRSTAFLETWIDLMAQTADHPGWSWCSAGAKTESTSFRSTTLPRSLTA